MVIGIRMYPVALHPVDEVLKVRVVAILNYHDLQLLLDLLLQLKTRRNKFI